MVLLEEQTQCFGVGLKTVCARPRLETRCKKKAQWMPLNKRKCLPEGERQGSSVQLGSS